jgi:acetoin utilization deacetylase AcuC-like enzyme
MKLSLGRLRARWRLRRRVGLWYHPAYEPRGLSRTGRVPSIPLDRVDLALGQLADLGLVRAGSVRRAPASSFEDLALVHSQAYLESAMRAETLGRIFAIEPGAVEPDPLLEAQRRAVGGTVAAAREVVRGRVRIGFNLGGGFHHSEPDEGSGLCVFNDVAVAVALVRREGYGAPIAIVDLDFHQGNGNLVTFARDPTVFTYSIHGSVWSHAEASADEEILLPPGTGDGEYMDRLRATLPATLERHRPRLVVYLAGNDVLAGDPLGGFALTPAGVLERDRFVVGCARAVDAGLVITLAGGYRPDAWRCTAALVRWLLTDDAGRPGEETEDVRARFRRIARSLDPAELQRVSDQITLTEADVMADLDVLRPAPRLLDYYTEQGVEYAFERYGILDALRRQGLAELRLSVDPADPQRQFVRIHGRRADRDGERPVLLMELVVRRLRLTLPVGAGEGTPLEVLSVEWLLLQDPWGRFHLGRPPLPGQDHPGLGIAREIEALLVQACIRLELHGLRSRPAHYHGAAAGSRQGRFLDPAAEGAFLALRDVLGDRPLHEASALLERGAVRTGDEAPVVWAPSEQVLAVSPSLEEYFRSPAYLRKRDEARRRLMEAGLHVDEPRI